MSIVVHALPLVIYNAKLDLNERNLQNRGLIVAEGLLAYCDIPQCKLLAVENL
jgi:hypothetical protein